MTLLGKGRQAIEMIVDEGTFQENMIDQFSIDPKIGPPAVVGTAKINGQSTTVLSIDAMKSNPRFRVVYSGVIGMEEAYKMAEAVYYTIEADRDKPKEEKRPILLIVDTPGNGPGKLEEIIGMNKATGSYQLALAEARKLGHPSVAMVIGRAISGAFLCHGLQADLVLSLPKEYNTMVHVMPVTSIARITKIPLERLQELSKSNPVFASGAEFVYNLGGINEIVENEELMRDAVRNALDKVKTLKAEGKEDELGPWGRVLLGVKRGGRPKMKQVMEKMREEVDQYLKELEVL
jgi:malonate decarboxylase gamma subunit